MNDFIFLNTVDSTNLYAEKHFDELSDGMLIQAGTQTSGRGRVGRLWHSPEGNLYCSYVMKEFPGDAFYATVVSSLAVISAIREVTPQVDAWIKWPNDVYVGSSKLCGILCEGVIRHGEVKGIICGIGVNVNMSQEQLNGVGQPATSLFNETKSKINLKNFTKKLAIFLKWYYITGIRSKTELFEMWKKENRLIGETVEITEPDGKGYQAYVEDIGLDGLLRIRRRGSVDAENFSCGDVKIIMNKNNAFNANNKIKEQ